MSQYYLVTVQFWYVDALGETWIIVSNKNMRQKLCRHGQFSEFFSMI